MKTSGATADTDEDGGADVGPAQTGAFSEIIVSATKRETDLQKTPIAISVVDPQIMEDRHIQSLLDLGDGAAPSLRVATFEARQSALTIGIRGIVPFDANQTARDQGVGVYIDGVYLGRQQGLNAALFDVQRIEVLRGPQGTLFGRNTEGGAVSIVTKEPTGEFGGRLEGGIGNFGSYSSQAHINLPELANIAMKVDGLIQQPGRDHQQPDGGPAWLELLLPRGRPPHRPVDPERRLQRDHLLRLGQGREYAVPQPAAQLQPLRQGRRPRDLGAVTLAARPPGRAHHGRLACITRSRRWSSSAARTARRPPRSV